MKNKKLVIGIAIAAVVIIAVLAIVLTKGSSIVGKYNLESMTMGGETIKAAQLKELGGTATIEFKKDGTGVMNLFGDKTKFKYDKKYIIVDKEKSKYTYKDGKITMSEDGTKIVFTKAKK